MHKKDFGNNLKRLRENAEMSQGKLAEELMAVSGSSYSRSNVSKWESGDSIPPLTLLPSLSKVLGAPLIEFFGSDEAVYSTTLTNSVDDLHQRIAKISRAGNEGSNVALLALIDELYLALKDSREHAKDLEEKIKTITSIIGKS